jgi:hypothetical protein
LRTGTSCRRHMSEGHPEREAPPDDEVPDG